MDITALQTLLRDIDTRDVNAFARTVQTPADWILTQSVLPEVRNNTNRWKTKRTTRKINAAKYRAFDAPVAQASRRAEIIEQRGELPPLGQILNVSELEAILLETGRGADASELEELLYDDVERHVYSIRARLEIAAGDLLVDGKFSLAGEGGLYVEYDAGVPSANLPTAATPWSNPAADAIADELAWIELLRASGAPLPERALTSHKVWAFLGTNESYRRRFYNTPDGDTPPAGSLTPDEVNNVRGRFGLPPITRYDVQIDVDGVSQRVIPEDRYLLIPPNVRSWGETQYGVTAEGLLLSRGQNPAITREDAPGIVITTGVTDNPVTVYTKGAAAAMPTMYVPDIYVCAKVLA